MKKTFTILLIFILNPAISQKGIDYKIIDTLSKRSDFVAVVKILDFRHLDGMSLDLFNEISFIQYEIISYYEHKSNQHFLTKGISIDPKNEFQFQHRCSVDDGDSCSYRQFTTGDTCIIFLKLKDSIGSKVELTCHGYSPYELSKYSSLHKKTSSLDIYLNSIFWTPNRDKIIQSIDTIKNKVYTIHEYYTEFGILFQKTNSSEKGNKNYFYKWEYNRISGVLEKHIYERSKILKRKHPVNTNRESYEYRRVKYVERNGEGKVIKRESEVVAFTKGHEKF